MVRRSLATLLAAAAFTSTASLAQTTFVEVGAGLGAYNSATLHGGGVAAADYDDDGDVDLFVPNEKGTADQLYRNQGNGTFQEIAASVGLASTLRSRTALWLDYDGDHRMDLFVAGDCFTCILSWCTPINCSSGVSLLRLYRQLANGSFQDVTAAAGLTDLDSTHTEDEHYSGASAADINNDGYLDIFVATWEGGEDGLPRLFLNNTDGTFTDITASAGVQQLAAYWQTFIHDLSADGYPDIYTNEDNLAGGQPGRNNLWINDQDETFTNGAASAGVDTNFNEMGLAAGDFDNDGDLELYVTNIFENMRHNILFRNDSTPPTLEWTNISAAAGVDDGGWGWGATAIDIDNDGLLDLAATNGWFGGTSNSGEEFATDTTRVFHNNGTTPMTFDDVSADVNITDTHWGSGLISFDYDRDGDQDLLQTTTRFTDLHLYQNRLELQGGPHHYLVVRPRMEGPNHWAIGANVRIEVGRDTQMRPIHAGISFLSQEPAEAFFGVGSATVVDRVVVEFPDGSTAEALDVAVDQVIELFPDDLNQIFADGFESGDTTAWSAVVP